MHVEKRYSEINLMMDIPNRAIPCRKAECDLWRGGECIQIEKRKPEKPQVFSKREFNTFFCDKENTKGNSRVLLADHEGSGMIPCGNIKNSQGFVLRWVQQYYD